MPIFLSSNGTLAVKKVKFFGKLSTLLVYNKGIKVTFIFTKITVIVDHSQKTHFLGWAYRIYSFVLDHILDQDSTLWQSMLLTNVREWLSINISFLKSCNIMLSLIRVASFLVL